MLSSSVLTLSTKSAQAGLSGHGDLVVDPNTGYAIYGYDPVAYFDLGQAVPGVHGVELQWHGAYWRFLHDGNLGAFKAHPDVYAPQFGGYDPLSLSRGYTTEGNPLHWIVQSDQLFMFSTPVNRRIWLANPPRYLEEAKAAWGRLKVDGIGVPDPALNRLFSGG